MQPSKIYYERNFPLNQPFLFEKYGMEVIINPGETEDQAYAYAIEAIHAAHGANNPPLQVNPEYAHLLTPAANLNGLPADYASKVVSNPQPYVIQTEKPVPEAQRVGSLIDDIRTCKELKVLETYKLLAKKTPELQAAYDEMLKKLSQ